jgi:hypothetical protein
VGHSRGDEGVGTQEDGAVFPGTEVAVVGAVLVLSVWSNRSEKRAMASLCSWRRWRPGALEPQPRLSAWLIRLQRERQPVSDAEGEFQHDHGLRESDVHDVASSTAHGAITREKAGGWTIPSRYHPNSVLFI